MPPPPKQHPDPVDVDLDDEDDDLLGPRNPYASAGRWRHQESSAFARHAAQPREAEARGRVNDLADFLNSTRISPEEAKAADRRSPAVPKSTDIMAAASQDATAGPAAAPAARSTSSSHGETEPAPAAEAHHKTPPDGKEIAVGPLLNYRRMEGTQWHGSVLVVTKGGGKTQPFVPTLVVRQAAPDAPQQQHPEKPAAAEAEAEAEANAPQTGEPSSSEEPTTAAAAGTEVEGVCLYSDARNTFWRFNLDVTMEPVETRWEYTLPGLRFHSKKKPRTNFFFVPATTESMRVMFHSCNGFSVGTDEDSWSGPALWNDVLRKHKDAPFHVMIGGGDQIYNDGIRVNGPLRKWTAIGNPKKRREYPFPEKLRQECDDYYLKNYIRWYGTEPFATANGQIPQLNIWDDHDIIDGFGSYVNEFMKCDVFRGIGGTAHKYYMLFQHHLPPPPSTYTTDAPQTTAETDKVQRIDPEQLQDTYVAPRMTETNYIIGPQPGPYVVEHSHNMYARLGARMAFLGIDARTERTRHQINYPETYDAIFGRLTDELRAATEAGQPIKHLILLLGIPIAYPRLTWLENVFSSPIMGPVKFMNRRFGLGGGIFNHFDGSVDLLDDLDDHYTARTHKRERNALIERLQTICAEFSVRITILGGDVHLAAVGRFYANPKLQVPTEKDHRYMVNVVSSAIVNKPPPQAIANLLARRNKIHHLNEDTDETLLKMFNKDPGDSNKTAGHNHVTMPSRNYATLTENSPNNPPSARSEAAAAGRPNSPAPTPAVANGDAINNNNNVNLAAPAPAPVASGSSSARGRRRSSATSSSSGAVGAAPTGRDGHFPLHPGESGAGTSHIAASRAHGTGRDGSLDVCIRVEVDQHDRDGHTEAYGLTIPLLACDPLAADAASHHGVVGTVRGATRKGVGKVRKAAPGSRGTTATGGADRNAGLDAGLREGLGSREAPELPPLRLGGAVGGDDGIIGGVTSASGGGDREST